MVKSTDRDELRLIRERYARRNINSDARYDPLSSSVYMPRQEKERVLIQLFAKVGVSSLKDKTLLEIGCGSGLNLLQLIRLGFRPENLVANELLEDRMEVANHNLPRSVKRLSGDATILRVERESFDVVYQSTVFSSILDEGFRTRLADAMWSWVRPGGGILWYDFIYDNPRNRDVMGVSVGRIGSLFPKGSITISRTTLAPPISRRVCRIHPSLYTICGMLPFLKTHVLCWIAKGTD